MRRRSGRLIFTIATAVALLLLAALGTAGATRTVRVPSKISIKSHGLTFSGRVSASKAPCRDARHVTLHRDNGQNLGSMTTGPSGKWKIVVSGSAGISLSTFHATVARRTDGTLGTIYVCKAARSKTIYLHA